MSCDLYYGVNLLWFIMAHSMETYLISLFVTVANVLSPGQHLIIKKKTPAKQTLSGVVLLHSHIIVCDCVEDDLQLRGGPWHSERH